MIETFEHRHPFAVRMLRRTWVALSSATACILLAGHGVFAADLKTPPLEELLEAPAVSGVNGKIAAAFGSVDDEFAALGLGSLTVPLGHSFGLQGDIAYGSVDGNGLGGVAAHLFWRDPAQGLAGLYGSYNRYEDGDLDVGRAAFEGEVYFDRVSLEGILGAEFGDIDTKPFGQADIAYYATDNWRIDFGVRYAAENFSGSIGTEYQFHNSISAFAQGRLQEGGDVSAFAGLRFYFGDEKPLIDRHRTDDPRNRLPDDLFSITGRTPKTVGTGGVVTPPGGGDGYGYGT